MSISETQNLPSNVDLLAAQRRLYSDAKRARRIRASGSLLVGIPLPILAALAPEYGSAVTAIGGLWLFTALLLMFGFERGKTEIATKVLEEFDVTVFTLPWNERIAGKRAITELVANATHRSKEDRSQLADWYPPHVDTLPWPVSVLVCQKAAVVWDWRLRRAYGLLLGMATLALLVVSLVAGILLQYTVLQWLLVLALPLSAAFAGGMQAALSNLLDANEQSEMHARLTDDWEATVARTDSLTATECRQHQDCRFIHRLKATPIPDWWYRALRNRYEADMTAAARRMVADFESGSRA